MKLAIINHTTRFTTNATFTKVLASRGLPRVSVNEQMLVVVEIETMFS